MKPSRSFLEFLHRAHRRRLIWRAIEHAMLGMMIGCALSLILLLAIWMRGEDAIGVVFSLLIVSCVAGFIASFWRRPTLLDTSLLVEHLLGSPQLLSSAMLTTGSDHFSRAIRALADDRTTNLSLESLVLRRFTARTWSGMGLSLAAIFTLAMLLSPPADRVASASSNGEIWRDDAQQSTRNSGNSSSVKSETAPADPSSPESRQFEENLALHSQETRAFKDGAGSAVGAGSSRTSSENETAPRISFTPDGALTNQPRDSAGGFGIAHDPKFSDGSTAAAGIVDPTGHPRLAPAWTSASWPTDRVAALDAIRAGAIPDQYRDLVRDYFDHN